MPRKAVLCCKRPNPFSHKHINFFAGSARMHICFSHREIRDLLKAWLLASLAFAIAMTGLGTGLIITIPMALATAGVGFLLHELMHKTVAIRFGAHAEFRSFDRMLIMGVLLSMFGLIFLAPGAVFFQGQHLSRKQHGMIALAGPVTNIVLALLFLPLIFLDLSPFLNSFARFGYFINAWLGMFNMLPFMGLDGQKVMAWNKPVFAAAIGIAVMFVFAGFYFF